MTPTVTLYTREDLLAFVPYQLGFHPADSVVVLGLAQRRIKFTARCDADTPKREAVRLISHALRQSPSIGVVALVGYGPEWVGAKTIAIMDDLEIRRYAISDAVRVTDGRYFCLRCEDCTPASGVPFDITITEIAAVSTYAGMILRPDREAVEKLVKPIGGIAAMAMTQAVDRAEQRLASFRDSAELIAAGKHAVDHALTLGQAGDRLPDDTIAWLSVLITDPEVRDHAWARTDDEPWQLDLWLDLTRRAEPVLATPFATLLGWSAWRQGDGVLALAALERAYRIDPTYELARVLLSAVIDARPPTVIEQWPLPPSR
ncbi:MAG TPA: DUF4192 domain-containing protein [Candidatus Limnocylindrales bacterium]|nr:DUF4192 domain-containing protein [Candidatus Limnocylindrales bacterium]